MPITNTTLLSKQGHKLLTRNSSSQK